MDSYFIYADSEYDNYMAHIAQQEEDARKAKEISKALARRKAEEKKEGEVKNVTA